jgi:hypothetical protein
VVNWVGLGLEPGSSPAFRGYRRGVSTGDATIETIREMFAEVGWQLDDQETKDDSHYTIRALERGKHHSAAMALGVGLTPRDAACTCWDNFVGQYGLRLKQAAGGE